MVGTAGNLYFDTAGQPNLGTVDPTTGAVIDQFTPASASSHNGRGAVVVVRHGAGLGEAVALLDAAAQPRGTVVGKLGTQRSGAREDQLQVGEVAGSTGLSTIAFDGTNFWIGDYSGTNQAYYYTPSGTLLKTITLSGCTQFLRRTGVFQGPNDGPRPPDLE